MMGSTIEKTDPQSFSLLKHDLAPIQNAKQEKMMCLNSVDFYKGVGSWSDCEAVVEHLGKVPLIVQVNLGETNNTLYQNNTLLCQNLCAAKYSPKL